VLSLVIKQLDWLTLARVYVALREGTAVVPVLLLDPTDHRYADLGAILASADTATMFDRDLAQAGDKAEPSLLGTGAQVCAFVAQHISRVPKFKVDITAPEAVQKAYLLELAKTVVGLAKNVPNRAKRAVPVAVPVAAALATGDGQDAELVKMGDFLVRLGMDAHSAAAYAQKFVHDGYTADTLVPLLTKDDLARYEVVKPGHGALLLATRPRSSSR